METNEMATLTATPSEVELEDLRREVRSLQEQVRLLTATIRKMEQIEELHRRLAQVEAERDAYRREVQYLSERLHPLSIDELPSEPLPQRGGNILEEFLSPAGVTPG
jgi:predicted  nucleic acid-binding Zn-ribbon protein